MHAGVHRFNDNRKKKRVRRTLWNIEINAGARINGISYSKLINALKVKHVELDRKILASLAEHHPTIFKQITEFAGK